MLVINRREQESIFIGNDNEIEIKVLSAYEDGQRLVYRVGISAPKNIPIRRDDYLPKAPIITGGNV